jgi:hypothetical protein
MHIIYNYVIWHPMMVCKTDYFGWPRTCWCGLQAASSWWRHVPSQRSASKWTGDPLGISYEYSGSYIGSYVGRCIIIGSKLSNDTWVCPKIGMYIPRMFGHCDSKHITVLTCSNPAPIHWLRRSLDGHLHDSNHFQLAMIYPYIYICIPTCIYMYPYMQLYIYIWQEKSRFTRPAFMIIYVSWRVGDFFFAGAWWLWDHHYHYRRSTMEHKYYIYIYIYI